MHSTMSTRPCTRVLQNSGRTAGNRLVVKAQVKLQERPAVAEAPSSSEAGNEIYIGFEKGDYAPRAGRKGRFIRDDPKKYPAKEDLGLFTGATGGWAGGEVGLWQFREQDTKASAPVSVSTPTSESLPKPDAGKDLIYLGYGKDELEKRKSGAKGRVIVDDPAKYPSKEDIGIFTGLTGGFAGGEKGLDIFVTEGEVRLRQPGEPARSQFSPVSVAGLLVAAGAGGGLLLNSATDLGEGLVKAELMEAPIDDSTKTLLLAAVALLGAAGTVAGARAALRSFNDRLQAGASKLLVLGSFWLGVFFAARAVLEL